LDSTQTNVDKSKGRLHAGLYYIMAILVSIASHFIFGWEYIHAPPLSFFIFSLFLVGGGIWALIGFLFYIKNRNKIYQKGALEIHFLVLVAVVIYACYLGIQYS